MSPEENDGLDAYNRRSLELRAADFYASIRKPESEWKSIDDLAPQLAEFEHRFRAGDYDDACRVLEQPGETTHRTINDYLFMWGYYARLVEMREKLQDHLTDEGLQAANQGHLGQSQGALGQIERGIELLTKARDTAHKIGNSRQEGIQIGNLGLARFGLGQFEQAIKLFEEALAFAREPEIKDRQYETLWLSYLGFALLAKGDVDLAVEPLNDALTIARQISDLQKEGTVLGALGFVSRTQGDVERAIGEYKEALEIARMLGDRWWAAIHLGNIGSAYRDLGQFERATVYYKEALDTAHETGDIRGRTIHLARMGVIYCTLGQFERAIEFLEEALAIARQIGDSRTASVQLGRLGIARHAQGQVERAIELYQQSLAIAREINDHQNEHTWLKNLGSAYLALGRIEEAIESYEQAKPETSYQAALGLGIARLRQDDAAGARVAFANAADLCRARLDKTAGLYEARYALAAALAGQAVCNPLWVEEGELPDEVLEEYRRALENCAAPGVVRKARRDLEMMLVAGADGWGPFLEPVFKLLEEAEREVSPT